MDDLEPDFHSFDHLPGVDLYLWLRLLVAVLLVSGAVATGVALS